MGILAGGTDRVRGSALLMTFYVTDVGAMAIAASVHAIIAACSPL
jgi:hypothetical protein